MTPKVITAATWDRYTRMCRGKKAHANEFIARTQAERLEKVNPGHFYNVYQCEFCTRYHVGHHWRSPRHEQHEAGMQSVR